MFTAQRILLGAVRKTFRWRRFVRVVICNPDQLSYRACVSTADDFWNGKEWRSMSEFRIWELRNGAWS